MSSVEGYLDLPVFIGNTNVKHRFYVMKPGKVLTQVILGQPWSRTYNGVPNWKREGINFEYDHARLFTPFLTEDDFTTDSESEEEETEQVKGPPMEIPVPDNSKEPIQTKTTTTERAQKLEEAKLQDTQPEMNKQEEQQGSSPEDTQKKASQQATTWARQAKQTEGPSKKIWVPKKLAIAQKGSSQIWIPRQKAEKHTPYKIVPTKKTKRRATMAAKSRHTNKSPQNHKNSQEIWLPKALLQAQQDSQYKWIPKHLLRTIPTLQQPRTKKKPQKQQLAQPTRQNRWVPKHTLEMQGYYEGATHVWLTKQAAKTTNKPREQPLPILTNKAPTLQKKMWVKKAENQQQTVRQVSPMVSLNTQRRATAQEKGKWVPKVAKESFQSHTDELPSTSQQEDSVQHQETIKELSPPRPRTLDAAQHLAFILKAFNSKQVTEHLKRFMTHSTSTQASSAKALGPYMLQDPSLAPH